MAERQTVKIEVEIPSETQQWILAFCVDNKITPAQLTGAFMESIADHAGRREGCWESYAIEDFVTGHGWAALGTRFNGITQEAKD